MTRLENILHALYIARIRSDERFAGWAYDAIAYYIGTDRASVDWLRAVERANPDKLIAAVAKSDNCSTNGMIATATKYLRRYCKLGA